MQRLSRREKEVVSYICLGCTYTEIAEKMNVKPETVKTLARRIRRKLNVRSKTEIVLWVARHSPEYFYEQFSNTLQTGGLDSVQTRSC